MAVNSLGRKKGEQAGPFLTGKSAGTAPQVGLVPLFWLPKGSGAEKHQPLLGNQRNEWNASVAVEWVKKA